MDKDRITILVRKTQGGRVRSVHAEPHEYELPADDDRNVHEVLRQAGFQPVGRGETLEQT